MGCYSSIKNQKIEKCESLDPGIVSNAIYVTKSDFVSQLSSVYGCKSKNDFNGLIDNSENVTGAFIYYESEEISCPSLNVYFLLTSNSKKECKLYRYYEYYGLDSIKFECTPETDLMLINASVLDSIHKSECLHLGSHTIGYIFKSNNGNISEVRSFEGMFMLPNELESNFSSWAKYTKKEFDTKISDSNQVRINNHTLYPLKRYEINRNRKSANKR